MLGIVKESAAENKFDLIFNSRPSIAATH